MQYTHKTTYFLFVSLMMIWGNIATAQILKTDPNAQQQPTKIIIVEDGKDAESTQKNRLKYTAYPQQFIKIRPFSALTGKVPVYFESMQTQQWGYEVGAGITFRNYLFQEYYDFNRFGDVILSSQTTTDIWDTTDSITTAFGNIRNIAPLTRQLGLMLSGALKYYYNTSSNNVSYVSILTDYRNQNSSVPRFSGYEPSTNQFQFDANNPIKQSINTTNVSINVGARNNIDNFVIDFYLGGGVRHTQKNNAIFGDTAAGKPANGIRKYTSNTPIITSGISIGIPTQRTIKNNRKTK